MAETSAGRRGQLRLVDGVSGDERAACSWDAEEQYRAAYDILARPRGSAAVLERRQSLVRPNFLSGVFGGITLAQYRRIRRLPGIAVAAPIANLGYIFPFDNVGVPLNRFLTQDADQLFRVRVTSIATAGTSRYPGDVSYVYFTRRFPIDRQCSGLQGRTSTALFCRPRSDRRFDRQLVRPTQNVSDYISQPPCRSTYRRFVAASAARRPAEGALRAPAVAAARRLVEEGRFAHVPAGDRSAPVRRSFTYRSRRSRRPLRSLRAAACSSRCSRPSCRSRA